MSFLALIGPKLSPRRISLNRVIIKIFIMQDDEGFEAGFW